MKKKLIYRLASLGLVISCALVSIPVEGLSGVLTVYAEENTEMVDSTEEITEESTEVIFESTQEEITEETTEIITEESSDDYSELITPLADETEVVQEIDSVYLDSVNNVSYYYYGYSDGTAKIYNATFPSGGILNIPSEINSYTVTQINLPDIGSMNNNVTVSVLTIPESITYIGASFRYMDIGTLNYNTNATNYGTVSGFAFADSTIGNLKIGDNVEYIDTWTFEGATFLFSELTLSVKTIGAQAFRGVWSESNPGTLTLTEAVESIGDNAFSHNDYTAVNFNTNATSEAWQGSYSVFLYSTINALNIGANVTNIGSYMFYETYVPFTELTLNVSSVEKGAFGKIWTGDAKCTLTLTENVTYIEDEAFCLNNFSTVNYKGNASTKVETGPTGIFYHSNIDNLVIAPSVTKIAAYAFNDAYFNFNELVLDVETVGTRAFSGIWAGEEAGTLTITERVTYIYPSAFAYANFAKVNYNASADGESDYDKEGAFYTSNIGTLIIGENVTKLPDFVFHKAVFGANELTVNVETIGSYAFGYLWSGTEGGTLHLGERVSFIGTTAFGYGKYAKVNYSANADGESTYNTEAIFCKSTINDIYIGENVTKIPDFAFYEAYFKCYDLTIDVESIGECAFGLLWSGDTAGTLTLGERVSFIGSSAFTDGNYAKVIYKANADSDAVYNSDAIFEDSTINALEIGTNVTKLPQLLFYLATFNFEELTVNVETIGNGAFAYVWSSTNPGTLTLGEKLTSIEENAFGNLVLNALYYNADASLGTSSYSITPVFNKSIIYKLEFGEEADVIGAYMFRNSDIRDTEVEINVKQIGSYAFYNAWTSSYPAKVTIGEKVEIINTNTFSNVYFSHLQYNAKNVSLTTTASTTNSPFSGATVSTFSLGEGVEKINDYTFYNMKITQEDLIIPDSVTHIGKNVFNCATASNMVFINLYIGSGLQNVKYDSFGKERTFTNIYVDALTADSTYKSTSLTSTTAKASLPKGENVYIHGASDFYYYFAGKGTNINLYCENHFEQTKGEEYLDETTLQYVTPTYDTCEVCSYARTTNSYEDAYIVNFYVNGELYHTAYTKANGTVETPENPVLEAYNFTGWDKELTNITENMDINAVFEVKKYTVTFKNYDGTVIETQIIEHGSPAFEPTEPTRAGHTFTGWDKSFDNITADTEITATYDVNYYTVTFQDHDGTKISEQTVAYGSGATAPENPTREGYNFTGWDTDFSNISGDTTVTAEYRIKIMSVIFKVFNDIFSSQEVEYGDSATDPGNLIEIVENWGRWIFLGWDNTWDYITENLIINAIMEQDYNIYTVTFLNADGSVIDTQTVKYGDYVVVPEDPVREGHTFTGWGGGNINLPIAEDMTFTAIYEPIYYNATFVDEDGNILSEVAFGYFAGPNILFSVEQKVGHTIMWKPSVEVPGYEYLTPSMVTSCQFREDVTLTLYYKPDVFSIQFLDWDGTVLKEESVEYGKSATPPENPVRKGYTFKEWGDGSYDFIDAGIGFIAQYDINYYTVTFVDYDGTVLSTQEIYYQGSANAPVDPVREGCTFTGWDVDYSNVEEDITVTAQYNTNKYTVRFEDYDGTEIDVQEVEHGNAVVPPEAPTREGYKFIGWDKSTDNITGNTVITATYEINEYTVTFVDYNGSVIDTQTITYGGSATLPTEPTREGHSFKEWSGIWENIKKDETVTAVYDINTYNVTFKDYDGSLIDTQSVSYGGNAIAPNTPTREGYDFTGWDKQFTNITSDTEITATYTIKMFTVIFKDNTNIISTQQIAYGNDAVEPENPTRPDEAWGVWVFQKWDITWTNIKENTVINAVFEKKLNQYTVTFVDYDGSVLATQTVFHGSSATAPEEPTRDGYTFKQWDKDYSNVTENMTVTAVYEINSYVVTFVDYDGSVLDTQNVKYQQSAVLPETPTRVGYTFKAWSGTWENITKDSTVTATYDINIYKVDFVDYDGTLIDSQSVEHGKSAIAPETPIRDGYTFKNWDKDYSNITENLIITAVYEKNHVHEYSEETERKDSTCIEKGYVICKCSCGDTEKTELNIAPDNHTGETEVKDQKTATCTEKGYSGDTYCKSCNTKIKDGEETDLAEHIPGETKVENRVEPTTEAKGSYDEVIYCEVCEKELSRNTVEIPIIIPEEPDEPEDSEEEEDDSEEEESEEEDEEDTEEESETPIETETEEPTEIPDIPTEPEEEEEPQIEDVIILIAATAGVAGSTGTVYFVYWRRRRKILGNVLDENGNPVVNAKVYIEGSDVKETVTDENGYFEFKNLKVGLYKFMLCNDLDVLLMEAEIYTEEKDIQNAVTPLESRCEVEVERIGKNISLILTIK